MYVSYVIILTCTAKPISYRVIRLKSSVDRSWVPIQKELNPMPTPLPVATAPKKKLLPTLYEGDIVSSNLDIFFLSYPGTGYGSLSGSQTTHAKFTSQLQLSRRLSSYILDCEEWHRGRRSIEKRTLLPRTIGICLDSGCEGLGK